MAGAVTEPPRYKRGRCGQHGENEQGLGFTLFYPRTVFAHPALGQR